MQAVLFVNYIIVDFQGNHGRPNSQSQAYSRATADNTTSMDIPWALPTYTAPTNFSIGSQLTEPLVNISQIKAHLALLHAFAELKNEVDRLATVRFRTFRTMFEPEPEHNVRGSVQLYHRT